MYWDFECPLTSGLHRCTIPIPVFGRNIINTIDWCPDQRGTFVYSRVHKTQQHEPMPHPLPLICMWEKSSTSFSSFLDELQHKNPLIDLSSWIDLLISYKIKTSQTLAGTRSSGGRCQHGREGAEHVVDAAALATSTSASRWGQGAWACCQLAVALSLVEAARQPMFLPALRCDLRAKVRRTPLWRRMVVRSPF